MDTYSVEGMSCAACVAHVEKAVRGVAGVEEVNVSLLTNSMTVSGSASPSEIEKAVDAAGYHATRRGAAEEGTAAESGTTMPSTEDFADKETPKMLLRLVTSVLFLLPLLYLSMGHMLWGWRLPFFLEKNHVGMGLAQMLLCIVIMLINRRFFTSGIKSTLHGAPNMDTLVALGSGVSFGYSVYILFAMSYAASIGNSDAVMQYMEEFYFESAAVILTLITVGKTLEAYSKGKTTNALKDLMDLAPKEATLLIDGKEVVRPAASVRVGDIFVVRSGESIPVDGVIIEGNGAIDESSLTGESIPVDKAEGDEVSVGTLNQNGFLRCRAIRVGADTTLSQIIRMVSDAAATKAPIAKIADQVAGIFVPVVLGIAAVTAVIWLVAGSGVAFALERAITVLVISCPCALGLATPVAIMVGNGVGAKNGILYKTAASLEAAGRADIIALDKTGTITEGRPVVTDLLLVSNVTESELLEIAYALEEKSEHPLAKAVTEYAVTHQVAHREAASFENLAGNGIRAVIDAKEAYAGKEDFIRTHCFNDVAVFAAQMGMDAYTGAGKTPLYFSYGGRLLGAILVADVIKEESPAAIQRLQDMGIYVVMLTGDNEKTARAIAKEAGVNEVVAGVLPDGKEEVIRRLQEKGRVIMVGDGINDAPALTRADVGFAIGAGTDVAMDAADVVLVNSRLSDAADAISLSKYVIRNIHQNLFWAFIYNMIGIPLAAGLWLPITGWTLTPMFGAAAMSLSSFSVVMNALRLNLVDIKNPGKFHKSGAGQENLGLVAKAGRNMESEKEDAKMAKTLEIQGMMCEKCEAHVRKALEGVEGVSAVTKVSHEEGVAEIETAGDVSNEALKAAVADAGYDLVNIIEPAL